MTVNDKLVLSEEEQIQEEIKAPEPIEVEVRKTRVLVGCTEKQVDKVVEMLNKGRRYFGSSGASLTHQADNPKYKDAGINKDLARVGIEGERKTTAVLRDWMKDKPNVVLIDSVHVKGYGDEELDEETGTLEGGDTDHILIIGNTVLIIDSKNWKGKRKYSITADGAVIRGTVQFPGGKLSTVRAGKLWATYLRPHRVGVSSIVSISSEKTFVVRDVNWWKQPFRLVTLETLVEFLDNVWEKLPPTVKDNINASLVASVAANAIKPYDVQKELLGDVHNLLKV